MESWESLESSAFTKQICSGLKALKVGQIHMYCTNSGTTHTKTVTHSCPRQGLVSNMIVVKVHIFQKGQNFESSTPPTHVFTWSQWDFSPFLQHKNLFSDLLGRLSGKRGVKKPVEQNYSYFFTVEKKTS